MDRPDGSWIFLKEGGGGKEPRRGSGGKEFWRSILETGLGAGRGIDRWFSKLVGTLGKTWRSSGLVGFQVLFQTWRIHAEREVGLHVLVQFGFGRVWAR